MARREGEGATQEIRDPQTRRNALPRKCGDRPTIANLLAPSDKLLKSVGWKASLVD